MDTTNDDRAGDLATVTDDEWRAAHERLRDELVGGAESLADASALDEQFRYVWSPGKPAREGGYERDIAPPAGTWDGRLADGNGC